MLPLLPPVSFRIHSLHDNYFKEQVCCSCSSLNKIGLMNWNYTVHLKNKPLARLLLDGL